MKGLPVFQPENLKSPDFIEKLKDLNPDLQVVVAFRMLPKEVWALPIMGTFNLHASLLPQYRGAAPINWAIINGETKTGVTTFFIDESIDTGKIIISESVAIEEGENAGELHDRLMNTGAALVLKTVEMISTGSVTLMSQENLVSSEVVIKKAPKIHKEHCRIRWDETVINIYNLIRGLNPHPGAFTELTDKEGNPHLLKVFKAYPEIAVTQCKPGDLLTNGRTYIKIAAKDGFVHLSEIQPAGRKVMSIVEFLNGYGLYFNGNLR